MPQQWTAIQQIHFHFFLVLNVHRLSQRHKKNPYIFKQMSSFLRTKTAWQCRSHHQKRCEQKDLRAILRNFYQDYYGSRLLDVEHSKRELAHYLTKINVTFLSELNSWKMEVFTLEALLLKFQRNWGFVLNLPEVVECKDQTTQTETQPAHNFGEIRNEKLEFEYALHLSSQQYTEIYPLQDLSNILQQ